ncbi:hypothetical protein N7462_001630 [Penicillium macrosclerotiorum]|uniref:uncharacterized protein n=1 Tax=Penicillium macrosclerotiorum TaxID=303699 RepID=UPI00254931AE|nr:uncharacterized protein N7462_001630 [Penicillium macrosclerotiorum]KAJ5692207.1 hypothetical protein N7462_001630 [Penicillium macrosclerotiorum]
MFQVPIPSLRSLNIFSWGQKQAIHVSSVKIHDLEAAHEKPARALKHLLKLNHANHAILYNDRKFHNHAPHLLSAAYLQGADEGDLARVYESESKLLDEWVDSPAEVTNYDWRDHLGRREYQKAFVDFFEDEMVRLGYDWKQVVAEYLFSGKEPVFNSIMADLGHPLIHLAYAFEMSSRELAMEALGLAATCYNSVHNYLDDPISSQTEPSYHSTSFLEILDKVRADKKLNGLFVTPGDHNMQKLFESHEAVLLNHWNAWKVENPMEQFRESQELAAALLVATHEDSTEQVLLPLIPPKFQISLVRQWWLVTLAIFISQLRPEISFDKISKFELKGRGWSWASKQAVKGKYSTDSHYVKAIRALQEAASTWGDHESFYLKAAVKFAEEFSGWGGFV